MDRRLSRRKPPLRLALALGALVLAVPGVTACGFNYATDRANTISNGAHNQDGTVDVLNALIVSSADGSGTFIATLSNNDQDNPHSLTSLSFGSSATASAATFSPIEVPKGGVVNLANGDGIKVSGGFKAGDFVRLTLGFDDGESSDLNVPVVVDDGEYDGLDNGTGTPSPTAEPSASESAS